MYKIKCVVYSPNENISGTTGIIIYRSITLPTYATNNIADINIHTPIGDGVKVWGREGMVRLWCVEC